MTPHRIWVVAAVFTFAATSAAAQPVAASLISPSSDVNTTTIAFTWQSAPTATWYHFWLGRADTSLITEHWYTAEHAGCASGGTCAITVTPPVTAGAYIWHIRTWSNAGYGPWSPAHMFTVRDVVQAWSGKLPPSRRFTLVLENAAVLDNETGLVWQRTPLTGSYIWSAAFGNCGMASAGGRRGWRLATFAEFSSLIDPNVFDPSLPPGHPFVLGANTTPFWTATAGPDFGYMTVAIGDGAFFQVTADNPRRVWCVRGGMASQ